MTFTQVFGGTTIYPSGVSYRAIPLTSNQILSWPTETSTNANVVAQIMDVTPSVTSLSIFMPPANEASVGETALFFNAGGNTFTVKDAGGNTIVSILPGLSYQVYLIGNTTANGTWRSTQYGAGTSSATAGSLVGSGIKAINTTLNQSMSVTTLNSNYAIGDADRSEAFVWSGGAGTLTLPDAFTVGSDWFCQVRNSGSGAISLVPSNGSQTINGAASLAFNPTDSAIIVCDGNGFFTIGFGQSASFAFDYVSISLTGQASPYQLSGANLNRIAYSFGGALSANMAVEIPATFQQYWLSNDTTRTDGRTDIPGYSITVKVAGQTGVTIANGVRAICYCNGTDLVDADTSSVSFPLLVAQGGTGAVDSGGALINLGGTSVGRAVFTAVDAAAARTAMSAAALGANSDITSLTGLTTPLSVAQGGSGQSTYANGQILIGNGTGLTKSTLTAGTNVSITNGSGSITINSADQYTGTVTSVSALTLGTTGTDLSSSVANSTTTPVITLNVPTASATNRGALSSTDWSTFNSKQAALVSGSNIKTVGGATILGSGDVGTIGVAYGGTGQTTYTNGQLLIGNTTGNTLTKATLTAGTGVAITNGAGSITITATGSGGTVTSVAALTLGTVGTDLSSSVATGTTTPVITLNVPTASAANRGALSSTDWSTFNGKQAALVSGTNIKTVGGASLLGTGDVGTVGVAYGGTGQTTYTDGQLLIGNSTGNTLSKATLTAGTGVAITNGAGTITIAATGSGGTVTSVDVSGGSTGLTTSGGPITGTGTITLAGTLAAANGGTGQSSYTVGDILYASTTTALSKLADVAVGNALISGGVGTAPSWGKIGLTTHVSGTLAIGNGGTGVTSTPTNGQLLIGNGTGYTVANITAGSGITVTNSSGGISIASTAGGGSVTSVSFTGGIVSVATPTTTPALTVAGTSGGIPYFSSASTWASSAALAANAIVVGGGAGVAPATVTTGTGVVTALGVNTGSAGAFVVNGGALGTPTSGTLTNATGLPVSTGITGFGTGIAAALAINAGTAGSVVVNGGALGTPSSGTLTNCTFPTLNQNTTGSAATLTTARTLTIGGTGKTFNGSANVSWTLSEIGAAASGTNTDITALDQDVIVTATGTIAANTIGYRGIPQNAQSSAYQFDLPDAGKHVYSTNTGAQTITVPTNATAAIPIGTAITVVNNGTTAITFTTTGTTVYKAGTSSAWASGGTLGIRGMATFMKVETNTWFVSGSGLS
jgi:hypothetical protein